MPQQIQIYPILIQDPFCTQISLGDVLVSINGRDVRSVPYDEVIRTIAGPAGTKVSLGLVRRDRHQTQYLHMHLRELMFHHRVVEITTLTRKLKRQSVLPRSDNEGCEGRALKAHVTSTHQPSTADAPFSSCSNRDVGEGATSWCDQARQPRQSTGDPRPAEVTRSPLRQPDAAHLRPPPPPAAAAEPQPPAGVSASVGEVLLSGHFQPLVLT